MVEISNKMLVAFILIAMVVSVGGIVTSLVRLQDFFVQIAGAGIYGEVNITVGSSTSINVTIANVTWGEGNVNGAKTVASVNTVGEVKDGNWTAITGGMKVENIGTNNVTLDFRGTKTAALFIGGGAGATPDPQYLFNISDKESANNNTCVHNNTYEAFYPVNTTNLRICLGFDWRSGSDEILIGFNLTIPEDSKTGNLNDTVVFTATAV